MTGRRLMAMPNYQEDFEPGDYYGPATGWTGDVPSVFYRTPNGSFGHVSSPPHTFRECSDGSLEIRNSIGHFAPRPGELPWHGFLDEGHVWRTA